MKHLRTFRLFESLDLNSEWSQSVLTDEVWSDISDILLELEDDGFVATKHLSDYKKVSNKLCEDVIEIVVNKQSTKNFNYEDVKDTFMRLIDYLEPYGWNYSILYFGEYHFIEFECGGKDPLAKVHNPTIIPNQLEAPYLRGTNMHYGKPKSLKDTHAFKICFYQGIDHLIN
jgi:hypothetical protein